MLSDIDHVASQEKEKLALQRVAEIRRLAVQLHIKQNMSSTASASNGSIDLLRKELIEKTGKILNEFDISQAYDFKLDFQEETMPELVSTLTKLRKFILAQIRLARHVNTIQHNNSNDTSHLYHSGLQQSSINNTMNSPSVMIRDFSNYSTPPKSTSEKYNNNNNNYTYQDQIQNKQKYEEEEKQQRTKRLQVKTPPSSIKNTSANNSAIYNSMHHHYLNISNSSNKEEEKNTSFLELAASTIHSTTNISNSHHEQYHQHPLQQKVSPNYVSRDDKMLLEDSISQYSNHDNDSMDEIDLRVRQEEMMRLRHFRQLAEQRVENKVNAIKNIMEETNHPHTYNNNIKNNIEEAEYHVVQNISPPPAPPQTPPRQIEYKTINNNNDQNDENPLETSLDALMSLASTPLSKLRQEENEIILQNNYVQGDNNYQQQQQQETHYRNVNYMYSPTTNSNHNSITMNTPITPNQMPVPIPINPSTPYAMPSPPKPFRQSTPMAPSSNVNVNSVKQRRNAVPQMSLQLSAEEANRRKRASMIAAQQQQQEYHQQQQPLQMQHHHQQQRRNAVPQMTLQLAAEEANRQKRVSMLAAHQQQQVVTNSNTPSYDRNNNYNRFRQQESSNFIDPEDDMESKQVVSTVKSSRFDQEEVEFKMKNSKVNFYDSKVKLGDISKVSFYESSGVDSSYGGEASAYQRQSYAMNQHQLMHQSHQLRQPQPQQSQQQQYHHHFKNNNQNVATNVHISRRGSVSIIQQQQSPQQQVSPKKLPKSRIPLPRSINIKNVNNNTTTNNNNNNNNISHKTNLLLQSSVERKYDSNFYPPAPSSNIIDNSMAADEDYDVYISDESFLPGSIHKNERKRNNNRNTSNVMNSTTYSNIGNNISNVTLQRPGESFAVAERRVRERLKKKKNEGNVKKKEDAIRKARLKKLEEKTKKAREESMRLRKLKNKKNGYAALAKKQEAEKRKEEKEEKAEAARKKTIERLRKKKIELAKKKKIEDAKRKVEEEKKWKIRDEKVQNFKERRAERARQKRLIEERAARNAARPKPQWNSTTANNNTIGVSAKNNDKDHDNNMNGDNNNNNNDENVNNNEVDGTNDTNKKKKIRKYSKPRPHDLFPKNMQKKRSSGLVPKKVPTVMRMQHRQHVDKKERGKGKQQQHGGGYSNIHQTRSSQRIPSKIPTMVVMAHTNHVAKKHDARGRNTRNLNEKIRNDQEQIEEEVKTMDDSVMSFDDVEKWIHEQEEYFSKSDINPNDDNDTRKTNNSNGNNNSNLIDLNEEQDSITTPFRKKESKSLLKKTLGNRRKSQIIENVEEDDKFLDSLLMDSGSGIGSILSPFKMDDM